MENIHLRQLSDNLSCYFFIHYYAIFAAPPLRKKAALDLSQHLTKINIAYNALPLSLWQNLVCSMSRRDGIDIQMFIRTLILCEER